MHYGQMMLQMEEGNTSFESGWQQLQKVNLCESGCLVDTLQEARVQEEAGWQPVLLSQRQLPALDQETLGALADLDDCLFGFLSAALTSMNTPQTQTLTTFTEVVIPQFNPRTGRWA